MKADLQVPSVLEAASHAEKLLGCLIKDEATMPSDIVLVLRQDRVEVRYRVGTSIEGSWCHLSNLEGVDVGDAFRQLAAVVDVGEKFVAQGSIRFPSALGSLTIRCTRSVGSDDRISLRLPRVR